MKIQANYSLKNINTFGLESIAQHFVEVSSVEELVKGISWAKENSFEILILGGGSNVLLPKSFEGLVIAIRIEGISVINETDCEWVIKVGAGENWHKFVMHCISKGWGGLENLSLIPGTVGASPMQNIGAYGVEIKDVFESLTALNIKTLKLETFDAESCEFGYRASVFKKRLKDQYIITEVSFKLSKDHKVNTSYGIIEETLMANGITTPTISDVSKAVIQIRQSKLPDPQEIGNAGSFFKNPVIPKEHYEKLSKDYSEIPGYQLVDWVKVPAAWLIQETGWKGKTFGEIGVHGEQPLVLVNYGEGQANEIIQLSQKIQASVLEKFGIQLETEVNFI